MQRKLIGVDRRWVEGGGEVVWQRQERVVVEMEAVSSSKSKMHGGAGRERTNNHI